MVDNRRNINEDDIKALTNKHSKQTTKKQPKPVSHKPFMFSLTEEVSEKVDDFTLLQKKTSRSDVFKAALLCFEQQSDEVKKAFLDKVKDR